MLQSGKIPIIAVSRILGHSKASVTLDAYGHMMSESQRFAVDYIDALVTPIEVDPNVLAKIDEK